MQSSTKIFTFSIMALTILAVDFFALPAANEQGGYSDSNSSFARCEACHPAGADTTKSSPHYKMKCLDCHKVSGFAEDTHTSTIPVCSDCHAGAGAGKQHKKVSYFSEPAFVFNPDIVENNDAVYVSLVKPVNGSI
ncbi:MAG: hypothetical protein PHU34_10700 [Candidatus Methanoperedens sp.]|nr:hypothetical protein [Candidatus Methanoperedens sp.]